MSTLILLAPLILLSATGGLLAKFNLIGKTWINGTGDLTSKVLIPALLLTGMYKNGLPADASVKLLLSYYLPYISLFIIFAVVFWKNPLKAQLSFSAAYSNTVLIGIPVVIQVMGESGLAYALPIIAFHSLIGFSLYYIVDAFSSNSPSKDNKNAFKNIFVALKKTLRNPIVLSLIIGLSLNKLGVNIPSVLLDSLTMIGQAAIPCALLVLGASLAQFKLQSQKKAIAIIVAKLVVLPTLVLISTHYVFQLPIEMTTALFILSTGPTGINAYILAYDDKKGLEIISSVILVSSLLYVLTLPIWLIVFNTITA